MYQAKVTDIIIGLVIHKYIAFYESVIYIYSANSNKSVHQIHKNYPGISRYIFKNSYFNGYKMISQC